LLPAALLFFLVAEYLPTRGQIAGVCLSFSLVGVVSSIWLLWNAWLDGWISPNRWAQHADSPLFVVANDVSFLAVIAPLSFAVLCNRPNRPAAIAAGLSLASTSCVIPLYQSRGALLALFVSLGVAGAMMRPRLAVVVGIALLSAAVIVDAAAGFGFAAKFAHVWNNGWHDSRFDIWSEALRTAASAPWLGHGPYTVVYSSAEQGEQMRWAHNLYLDVLVGQGAIGLVALVVLLVRAFTSAWDTHRAADPNTRALNAGACAALVAFCLTAMYETSLLRLWANITLFAVLGIIANLSATGRAES
jgi:O-antigen ligase